MAKKVVEKSPFIFSLAKPVENVVFPSFNEIRYFAIFASFITVLAFRPEITVAIIEAVKEDPRIGIFIFIFLIIPVQMVLRRKLDYKTKRLVCLFYYIFLAFTAMVASGKLNPAAKLTILEELSKAVASIISVVASIRALITVVILRFEWAKGERYIASRMSDEQYKPLVFLGVMCAAPLFAILASNAYHDAIRQLLFTHLGLLMGLKILDMVLGPRATHRSRSKKR